MKRTVLFVLMTIAIVTFAQAQGIGQQGQGSTPAPAARTPRAAPEVVTVTGNLTLAQGMIAVKAGDVTYLVPSLHRYVGFIDSLKDGAQVKLEGFAAPNRATQNRATPNRNRSNQAAPNSEKAAPAKADSKVTFFMPNKLTIGGKDYDLGRPQMFGMGGMQPRQQGMGNGRQQGMGNGRQQQGKGRDNRNAPQGRNNSQGRNNGGRR